ncbi:MAG: flagellar hook-basal body complex protein [Eubacteriales bacterium]
MMRSLYSGVSGLSTHQTKMDVIGNNIANVNTVAFKSSSITFSELMYQTTQSASGPNAETGLGGTNARQIGLGVKSAAISTSVATAGADQSTGNPFDIALTGDSFFVVSDGVNNYFTRAGAFYVDAAGNLAMTSNGYNVMGWGVDEDGTNIKKDTVEPLTVLSPENMTYEPEATSLAYISGIIDKNDTDVNSSTGKIMNLKVYDNLGYSYTAKISVKATSETAETGEYAIEFIDMLDSNNNSILDLYPNINLGGSTTITDQFEISINSSVDLTTFAYTDADGVEQTINLTTTTVDVDNTEMMDAIAQLYGVSDWETFSNYTVEDPNSTSDPLGTSTVYDLLSGGYISALHEGNDVNNDPTVQVVERTFDGCVATYDTDTGLFSHIGSTGITDITLNFPGYANFSDITIDFSTSSMYDNNGTSTVSATNGDISGLGKGRQLGALSGISIQTNGMIYASYDNGMMRLLGQIAVANFANPSGLEKIGDNLYQATLNSGEFDGIGEDISANGGAMKTGTLEMSNVDLSREFTEMITTQRGFQACSRIITVSDSLLEELTNLKR